MRKADDAVPHFTDGEIGPTALTGVAKVRITESAPKVLAFSIPTSDNHQVLLISAQRLTQLKRSSSGN